MSWLEGRAAVVTGAGRGIGRATAFAVAARGARVTLAARDGTALEEAAEEIRARFHALTVDEFLSWQRSIDKHGLPGLRATRVQEYRGS